MLCRTPPAPTHSSPASSSDRIVQPTSVTAARTAARNSSGTPSLFVIAAPCPSAALLVEGLLAHRQRLGHGDREDAGLALVEGFLPDAVALPEGFGHRGVFLLQLDDALLDR